MSISKYEAYRSEIERDIASGLSVRSISKKIAEKSGGSSNGIRDFIRNSIQVKESVVDETLHRNNMPDNWSCAWVKDTVTGVSVLVKNPDNSESSYEDFREDFLKEMSKHSPKYKKLSRNAYKDPHLLVVDIADLHIGKMCSISETGEEYNTDKAIEFAVKGVEGILQKAIGYDIEKILFVIGNDVLHTDTPKPRTTTSGTPQDTDGSWYDNFTRARKLYVEILERLISIADVHVVHNPSNHDYMSGYMLADSICSWFHNCKNVTFDVSNSHRKYYRYYNNLIGTSHGDGAKMEEMPLLMANEAPKMWAKANKRYVYLHHMHHKIKNIFRSGKDYQGVTVEYMRSPSATDSWHHINGYQHAPKAIEGMLHHREHGQVSRITHYF
jgi:hypothetical protein